MLFCLVLELTDLSLVFWSVVPEKSVGKQNANFAAYSPIVQRPYGLGVAKTLLRGWRHRHVCVLDLGL